MVEIRSLYEMPEKAKCDTVPEGESLTQQHFQDECDINFIISRYKKTGYLVDPLLQPSAVPSYADFSELPSYLDAQITIAKANEAFEALPALVRKRFNNNPAEFVDFCSDEENKEEMYKLGLAVKPHSMEYVEEEKPIFAPSGESKTE